jgi:hypothetical protein
MIELHHQRSVARTQEGGTEAWCLTPSYRGREQDGQGVVDRLRADTIPPLWQLAGPCK